MKVGVDGLHAGDHGADALLRDTVATASRLRTFHTLDALRGLAGTAIVLFHAGFIYGIDKPAEGQLAVDLFFAMSGFIVSYRYDADFRASMGLRRFLAVRLIRLYPLFLLGTLLGVLPAVMTLAIEGYTPLHAGMVASLPEALLMLPSTIAIPGNTSLYPLNIVSWSLALEVVVNAAYAATFRVWTLSRLAALVGVGLAAITACAAVFGTLHLGFDWYGVIGGPARILFGFSAGVLIQRLRARRWFTASVPAWLPIVATLVLLCTPAQGSKAVWEFCAVAIAVPAILVMAVSSEVPHALRRICAITGLYSYLVYSLHEPMIGVFLRGEARVGIVPGSTSVGAAVAFTALVGAACYVAHGLYDKPVRRALMRLLKRHDEWESGFRFNSITAKHPAQAKF